MQDVVESQEQLIEKNIETNIEIVSDIQRKLNISVNNKEVNNQFNQYFENVKSEITVPGFRKGTAPIPVIRSYLERNARNDIAQALITNAYSEAAKAFDFIPVGNPYLSKPGETDKYPGTFDKNNNYSVELCLDVVPKIDPTGYIGIELSYDEEQENVEQVAEFIMKEYREKFATHTVSDEGAEFGDTVVIDFTGYLDGVAFDGGTANGHTINKLGEANFIPGFEAQLVGVKAGEVKNIQVVFPENYRAQHLAGKNALFVVFVSSVIKNVPAEVDDQLAMMLGLSNLEELNQKVREQAENNIASSRKEIAEKEVGEKLYQINGNFNIPSSLVNIYLTNMVKAMGNNVRAEDVGLLKQTAELNGKLSIIFDAIYDKEESLKITEEELSQSLEVQAQLHNKSKDEMLSLLYNTNQMGNFIGTMKREKVLNFILANAVYKQDNETLKEKDDV